MWFQPTFFKLPQYHLLDNQLLLIHLKQYFINLKLICVSVQSWMDESQARVKIAEKNINNLRYADHPKWQNTKKN